MFKEGGPPLFVLDCLFICLSKVWGGVEKNVLLRLKCLSDRGFDVGVVCLAGTFEQRFDEIGIKAFVVTSGTLFRLAERIGVAKLIKQLRPKAVFAANKADWWLTARPAYLCNIRSVVLYLGIKRTLKQNIKYHLLFRKFGAVLLVNSYSLKNHVIATNRFLTSANVTVIHNGFGAQEVNRVAEVAPVLLPSLPANTVVIGCAGRLAPTKQYHLLAEIVPRLPARVQVLLAGEGAERNAIREKLEQANVAARVHFVGQLDHRQMPQFFAKLNLFLHLSRLEGMANVLNEALLYGVPVVTTRTSGVDEVTDHGRFGIITEIGDVEASVAAINTLIDGRFRFNAEAARAWITENFSVQQMIDKTEQLLFYREDVYE